MAGSTKMNVPSFDISLDNSNSKHNIATNDVSFKVDANSVPMAVNDNNVNVETIDFNTDNSGSTELDSMSDNARNANETLKSAVIETLADKISVTPGYDESNVEQKTIWSSWFGSEDNSFFGDDDVGVSKVYKGSPKIIKDFVDNFNNNNSVLEGGPIQKVWVGDPEEDANFKAGKNFGPISVASVDMFEKQEGYFGPNVTVDNDYINFEAGINHYEASGNVSAGFDPSNKSIYVKASVSAEYSLIHSELEIKGATVAVEDGPFAGLTLAGASGDVGVDVMHAEAKATAAMGTWVDENGERHTEVGLNAQANLELVSVHGTANVNVAGIQGSATAKAYIGIGGKFNVAYVDGKLVVVGAIACGPGLEFDLSLDVSGFVDNVEIVADAVGDWADENIIGPIDDFFSSIF